MKVTGKTTHTTVLTGEITKAEITAFIRQQLNIPEGAQVSVFVRADDSRGASPIEAGEVLFLVEAFRDLPAVPLRFEVTFEGEIPLAAPEPTTPEPGPMCTIIGCHFPSLAGGLCASHMSEAHRRRHNTLPSR